MVTIQDATGSDRWKYVTCGNRPFQMKFYFSDDGQSFCAWGIHDSGADGGEFLGWSTGRTEDTTSGGRKFSCAFRDPRSIVGTITFDVSFTGSSATKPLFMSASSGDLSLPIDVAMDKRNAEPGAIIMDLMLGQPYSVPRSEIPPMVIRRMR